MSATGIGAPVRRKEDFRFITGKGQYTDDVSRPGRPTPCFCARRMRMPRSRAWTPSGEMPGVIAVLTGADLAADKIGGLICGWMIHSKDGSPMKMAPHPAIAVGKVQPCRRSRRGGDRRNPGAGQGRRREGQGRLRRAAGGGRSGKALPRRAADPRVARKHDLSTGTSAIRTRPMRPSRPQSTSPGSTSSTTAWCRMRWSRAPRSREYDSGNEA